MNVVMVTRDHPFPIGMACTNRILSLAKGFVENGLPVKVVCLKPTEKSEAEAVNKLPRGVVNGIEYEYSCGTTVTGRTFVVRQWLKAKGMVRCLAILRENREKHGKGVLMAWVIYPFHVVLLFLAARMFGMLYVRDVTEYHSIFFDHSLRGRWYDLFYTRFFARFFDGIFVISKGLRSYYTGKLRKDAVIFSVPMTVETSRFMNVESPAPTHRRYIAYCGSLGGNKDGVPNLLRAFAMLPAGLKDVVLYIIGDSPDTDDLARLKSLAAGLGVSERVVFTGRVTRDEMPRYLCHAAILALARPRTMQAQGGFPSKVGEYLSTGKPVVLTGVGDIPDYLEDGHSAFIVEPDNDEAFAGKLEYVLTHPEIAAQVGLSGREVALRHFDHRVQARRTTDFLLNLNSGSAISHEEPHDGRSTY